jgi:hypothetical protein
MDRFDQAKEMRDSGKKYREIGGSIGSVRAARKVHRGQS